MVVFGDQLDAYSSAFDGFDPKQDAVLQMEVCEEATYIRQHKLRIAYFFSSMRHFREELIDRGRRSYYVEIDDPANTGTFEGEIERHRIELEPQKLIALEPGDWRVARKLRRFGNLIEIRPDRTFMCSSVKFSEFLADHPSPVMETFYRFMRRETGILMAGCSKPAGDRWNFDAYNRRSFGKGRRPSIRLRRRIEADATTKEVVETVKRRFSNSPGQLDSFDLPVTRREALAELDDFVQHRLPLFGAYQDAMLGGEPFLFHSRLSGPINLHVLRPDEVLKAALSNPSPAPLNSIEGFVRQILGWREFVRGIYWQRMPHYADDNALDAHNSMPDFYWTGETDMRCLSEAIRHTIDHAYAHHIERLMVLGLFALLLGVRPLEVHNWHMSMFWDAIDWVSLPNTIGMSQYGDGGAIGTKPYAASGNYIDRMSDHCRNCRYDPKKAAGDDACPFTTLYWDFLARNEKQLRSNGRMKYQYLNLDRKEQSELQAIRGKASRLIAHFG